MADPIWLQKLKNALSGPSRRPTYSVSGVEPATSAVSPNMYQRSFGDMPNIGYAAAGKPTVQYHTPMAGKKGLSMKNMIKALTEMKQPQGLKAQAASLHGESRPQLPGPPPFAPLGGVNQSIMNTGGLPGDRNKKWWEIMGYGR